MVRGDALAFPLCVTNLGPAPACALLDPVSVARGGVILVDGGHLHLRISARCRSPRARPSAWARGGPARSSAWPAATGPARADALRCAAASGDVLRRDRPKPSARPGDAQAGPAVRCSRRSGCARCGSPPVRRRQAGSDAVLLRPLRRDRPRPRAHPGHPHHLLRDAHLQGACGATIGALHWTARLDLLNGASDDPDFVVEMDITAGSPGSLRRRGSRPPRRSRMDFSATYRVRTARRAKA